MLCLCFSDAARHRKEMYDMYGQERCAVCCKQEGRLQGVLTGQCAIMYPISVTVEEIDFDTLIIWLSKAHVYSLHMFLAFGKACCYRAARDRYQDYSPSLSHSKAESNKGTSETDRKTRLCQTRQANDFWRLRTGLVSISQ